MTAAKTTTAKTTTAAKRPARVPQDRKPKAPAKVLPEQIPGWELLKPFSEIPAWEQTELFDAAIEMQELYEAGEITEMKLIGLVAKSLASIAIDEDAYLAYVSGYQAISNAAPLVRGWMNEMGKVIPSAL